MSINQPAEQITVNPAQLEGKVCEQCGKPAAFITAHAIVQLPPKELDTGSGKQLVRNWKVEGGYHIRCKDHKHEPQYSNSSEYDEFFKQFQQKQKQSA